MGVYGDIMGVTAHHTRAQGFRISFCASRELPALSVDKDSPEAPLTHMQSQPVGNQSESPRRCVQFLEAVIRSIARHFGLSLSLS